MAYTYTLKDIIEITGVTKRTLHYYDEIGLLVPDKNDKNYRVYKQQDLEKITKNFNTQVFLILISLK